MNTNTRTPLLERKGEYWYVDRSGKRVRRLTRALLMALALMVVMYTGACGGDMMGSLQQDYADAYGEASRETSLLDTTTATLTTSTHTLLDTTTATLAALVTATVTTEGSETAIYLNSSSDMLKDARVVLPSGDLLSFSLSGTSARLAFFKKTAWTHLQVATSSGGKWYFDNSGLPLPGGYTPKISVLPGGSFYSFASSDAISAVRFFYSDGNTSNGSPDPYGRIPVLGPVSYMIVGVKYDSSGKWYFDRGGLPLPGGYTPVLRFAWKNNSLYVESSDVFDKAVLYYTDYTKDSFSNSSYTAWLKPFRGKTVDGFMVRLKSDGSKWYFDNAGLPITSTLNAKWFSDMD